MGHYKIELLANSENGDFKSFLSRNDFSSGKEEVFTFYRSVKATRMFVAKIDGKIIGGAIAHFLGRTGWLGSIVVSTDYRRLGIGSAITEFAIDSLKEQGCEDILLRASVQGVHLYRTLGFRETAKYENFMVPAMEWPHQASPVGSIRKISRLGHGHLDLDCAITGEDHSLYLSKLPEASGIELLNDDRVEGFAFPTVGDGFLAVSSEERSIPLLVREIANGKDFKIRTLIGSAGNDYLHKIGMASTDGATRMVLGKDPLKKIRNVVGTLSSSIG